MQAFPGCNIQQGFSVQGLGVRGLRGRHFATLQYCKTRDAGLRVNAV